MDTKKHRHFLIYKPIGYISQFVNPHKRDKGVLGDLHDFPKGTMAIGRLDVKSEGLLMLTTDGKFSQQIRSRKVEKEYYAQVDGEMTVEALKQLQEGVEIGLDGGKYMTLPCEASVLEEEPDFVPVNNRSGRHRPASWVSITVREGKFRQVRKMTAAVGFPTLRLVRVRVGTYELKDMKPGEVLEIENV